jgi:hypothetical protein
MRKLAVALAAVLLMGIGAVVAYASIPGPDGVIHGCYKTSNPAQGALIAIDSAASCPSGYTALNWNQTGPQGPAGANGISGYEVVSASATPVEAQTGFWVAGPANATCPTGKVPLGGGATTGNSEVDLSQSAPNGNNGWIATANANTSSFQLNVYAICATVGS